MKRNQLTAIVALAIALPWSLQLTPALAQERPRMNSNFGSIVVFTPPYRHRSNEAAYKTYADFVIRSSGMPGNKVVRMFHEDGASVRLPAGTYLVGGPEILGKDIQVNVVAGAVTEIWLDPERRPNLGGISESQLVRSHRGEPIGMIRK